MTAPNRRKDARVAITLPVRVQGYAADGVIWEETTKCFDASMGGAAFVLKHDVRHGQVVHLSLPLPRRYRRYDPTATIYEIYAIVESQQPSSGGTRISTSFLGKRPPAGFEKNPAGLFSPERRRRKRGAIFLKVKLQKSGREEERTVLENFGAGGARVLTGRAFDEGEIVEIEDAEGSFHSRAEVRSIYTGRDGIRRINLRFLR